MTLIRDHGKIIFECDSCTANLETDSSNFDIALEELWRHNWRSYRRNGTYEHRCSDCERLR